VLLGRVEEVESILDLGYRNGILVGVVLEDELLKVQESTLVVHLLANLDEGAPGVLGGETCALGALRSLNHVLDLKDLLEDGGREDLCGGAEDECQLGARRLGSEAPSRPITVSPSIAEITHLLLNGKLDPETLRMRLGPNESSVDEADLGQSLELAQADGEQLPRLHLTNDPLRRRGEVARASLAEVDGRLLGDSFGDVDSAVVRKLSSPAQGDDIRKVHTNCEDS
jgi:hypothetical protein